MVAENGSRRQSRQRQTVAEMQNLRDWRANDQLSRYDFRLVNIAGRAAVYVISKFADRSGVFNIYTVHAKTCNCPDFQHRCSKAEGLECKHIRMVSLWLADCGTPEIPEPAPVSTVACAGCGQEKEGRACPTCGSHAVALPDLPTPVPTLTHEEATRHAEQRARYEADVRAGLWG